MLSGDEKVNKNKQFNYDSFGIFLAEQNKTRLKIPCDIQYWAWIVLKSCLRTPNILNFPTSDVKTYKMAENREQ